MSKQNQIVLVMGAPRSGTTLITSILNTHPHLAITNECNILKFVDVVEKTLFRKRSNSISRLRSPRETWALDQAITQIPQAESALFPMLRAYCTSIKPQNNVLLFGDKVPAYFKYNLAKFANKIDAHFLIIYVTRNPVDVVSSMLRRSTNAKKGLDTWSEPSTPISSLNWWLDAWNQRSNIRSIPSVRFLDLNYDAAIRNPKELGFLLSEFLHIDNQFSLDFVNISEVSRTIDASELSKHMPQVIGLDENWPSLPLKLDSFDTIYPLIHQPFLKVLLLRVNYKLKHLFVSICALIGFCKSRK